MPDQIPQNTIGCVAFGTFEDPHLGCLAHTDLSGGADLLLLHSPRLRSSEGSRLGLHFHDHFDLDAGAVGQRSHSHGGPGMGSRLTVQFTQKVGCSVGD